ncbi:hypothetical protein D3C72_1824430 [compost metagenome]
MSFGEYAVRRQAVIGEGHVLAQGLVENRVPIGRRIVVGKRTLATGLLVISSVGADVLHRENPLPGLFQRARIDVGGVDDGTVQQAFFAQHNGHRIHLFTGAASGDPDLDRRVGSQQRHHFLADGQEVRGVTKHLADRNGQQLQQLHESGRIVQDLFL